MVAPSSRDTGTLFSLDESMTELALLVPGWQAQALVEAAQDQGLTVGQLLRRVLDRAIPRPLVSPRRITMPG